MQTEIKKRLKSGQARVEYLAIRIELDDLLEKGHTLKGAYDILKDAGKITMAYDTLYSNYAGKTKPRTEIRKRNVQKTELVPVSSAPVPPVQQPQSVSAEPQTPAPQTRVPRVAESKSEQFDPAKIEKGGLY